MVLPYGTDTLSIMHTASVIKLSTNQLSSNDTISRAGVEKTLSMLILLGDNVILLGDRVNTCEILLSN